MKPTPFFVYVMFAEMRGIYDKVNIKIGVSDNPQKRLKGVQTGCPGDVHLIRTFEAGQDRYIHERYFHQLYKEFSTGGEWFEFDHDYFVEKVLPEMNDYFSQIDISYDQKESTTFTLSELLRDVDCAEFEINNGLEDDYSNRKIIQIKLKKAQTLVDDDQKVEFQKVIDQIQNLIDEDCKQKRKDDQETLALKCLKRKSYIAQKRLENVAMGILIGMN